MHHKLGSNRGFRGNWGGGGASYRREVGEEEGDREAGRDDSAQAFLRIGPQTLAKCYV